MTVVDQADDYALEIQLPCTGGPGASSNRTCLRAVEFSMPPELTGSYLTAYSGSSTINMLQTILPALLDQQPIYDGPELRARNLGCDTCFKSTRLDDKISICRFVLCAPPGTEALQNLDVSDFLRERKVPCNLPGWGQFSLMLRAARKCLIH